MKKIYIILGIIIVLTSTILFTEVENNKVKYVDYIAKGCLLMLI